MAGGSTKVVVFALVANLGIAIAKLVAAVATGSGAMMAESIHSFADSGNQGLLLLGGARAKRPANDRHPLGYGRESYFWALVVAVVLFTLGGLYSLYEGVHKLSHPTPVESPWIAIGVLLFGMVLEGGSLWAAWKECARVRGDTPLLAWARRTGNVNLLVVTLEDLAAMAGLLIALAAVALTIITGEVLYDAVGTCILGVLLLVVATFLVAQVRRLVVGSSASVALQDEIRAVWARNGFEMLRLIAVWSGPGRIMVACKVRPPDLIGDAAALVERVNAIEAEVRAEVEEIGFQFVELDSSA